MTRRPPGRAGFTLAEFAAGMLLVAVAGLALARLGIHAASERLRIESRGDATDAAADALESARAAAWGDLTPEWAAKQSLPEPAASRLPGGKLTVDIAPEPGRPGVKRVTARVGWTNPGNQPARPVTLAALFAEREGGAP